MLREWALGIHPRLQRLSWVNAPKSNQGEGCLWKPSNATPCKTSRYSRRSTSPKESGCEALANRRGAAPTGPSAKQLCSPSRDSANGGAVLIRGITTCDSGCNDGDGAACTSDTALSIKDGGFCMCDGSRCIDSACCDGANCIGSGVCCIPMIAGIGAPTGVDLAGEKAC